LKISLFILLLVAGACSRKEAQELVIFHAASLTRVLGELENSFERQRPEVDVRLEPSGSQVAARKISELGRTADLVLSADPRIINELLIPEHAAWQAAFAGGEMVLIFGQHSPGADHITDQNWAEMLLREGVRLGRCNERTAPLGYQTLQVWKLSERHCQKVPELAEKLRKKVRAEDLAPDAEELMARLQARSIDYAFAFASAAEEYNLRYVRLGDDCNLADPARATLYGGVQVEVELTPGRKAIFPGEPLLFSFTVPRKAAHHKAALEFLRLLLGPQGRAILQRSGFRTWEKGRCIAGSCPAELSEFLEAR
jgi:molybdate/tungstate transport system substrate-binding protein